MKNIFFHLRECEILLAVVAVNFFTYGFNFIFNVTMYLTLNFLTFQITSREWQQLLKLVIFMYQDKSFLHLSLFTHSYVVYLFTLSRP